LPDGFENTGLSDEILMQALEQAKAGRLHILNEMVKVIREPREDYKPHAPRIEKMIIPERVYRSCDRARRKSDTGNAARNRSYYYD
jgi:polyribonucleotide nucleotidyltransferase